MKTRNNIQNLIPSLKRTFCVIGILFLSFVGNAQYNSSDLGFGYLYVGTNNATVNTSADFEVTQTVLQNFPNVNTKVDLEDDVAFPSSSSLFYVKAYVGGRFQITGTMMSLHRSGDKYISRQFAYGDSVYEVGARVNGTFNTDYYSVSLRVSIIKNNKITAGLSLGGRVLKMDAGIDASSYGYTFSNSGSFTIPVIMPGVHGSVYVLPKLLVRGSLEYFSLKYKESKGSVLETQVTAEYYILPNLGGGVGYSILDITAEGLPKNNIFLRDVNYSIKGINLFAALRF